MPFTPFAGSSRTRPVAVVAPMPREAPPVPVSREAPVPVPREAPVPGEASPPPRLTVREVLRRRREAREAPPVPVPGEAPAMPVPLEAPVTVPREAPVPGEAPPPRLTLRERGGPTTTTSSTL